MPGKVKDQGKKAAEQANGTQRLPKQLYEAELFRLQGELVQMEQWVSRPSAPDRGGLRGPRRGRQGQHDQAGHRVPEPARRADRRAARSDRARADAVVLPALRRAAARRGRDRAVRPQLVQPRRRRARDGLLHPGGVLPVPAPVPDLRAAAGRGRDPAAQVLVLGQRRGAGAPVPVAGATTRCAAGSCRDRPATRARSGSRYSRAKDEMFVHTDIPEAPGGTSSRPTSSSRARLN